MKFVDYRKRPVYANSRWQTPIASEHPRFAAARDRVIEVYDLGIGVNAGISATGTLHPEWHIGDFSQSVFELVLNCDYTDMRLRLPTIVVAAVIFDATGNACTRRNQFS